jgi:long-chain fatty acid transport protein
MIRKSLLLLPLFLFCYSLAISQDGTRAIDYNTRSTGRGGVSIGFFDNPSTMLTNPAGMSFIRKPVLNANAIFMVPPTHFKNYVKDANGNTTSTILNDADGEKMLYVMPSLSYVHNFKNSKFTLGAGVFTTGGMGTEGKYNHQLFASPSFSTNYQQQIYRSRFAVVESAISGSYMITPQFSVGITGEFVYSTLELAQPFSLPPSFLKGAFVSALTGPTTYGAYFSGNKPLGLGYKELTASAEMTNLKSYTFGGKIGFAYKLNEKFSAGASYTMSVPLNYKNGSATMDMSAQFNEASVISTMNVMGILHISADSAAKIVAATFAANGVNPYAGFVANYDVNNEFKTPQSFGAGFMYSPSPKIRLGFDFEWLNWSKAFEKMTLTLTNGSNSNINKMLVNGAPGSDALVVEFPMKWKDAIILKFGGEFDASKVLTLRAGYSYSQNPIPSETIIPIMPAILVHHIMAGCSIDLIKQLTLNLALEYGLNNSVTGSNPHQVATEYNNSESSLKNLLGHISFTYNF